MRQIKIGGFLINVEYSRLDQNTLGEFRPESQTIVLQPNMTAQQERETLIHEVFEAINYIYDLELDHGKLSLLATVFHQVFIDNPSWVSSAGAEKP